MRRKRIIAFAVLCSAFLISIHAARAESNAFFTVLQEELRAGSVTTSASATSAAIEPGASDQVTAAPVSEASAQYEVYDAGRDSVTGTLAIFGGVFALIAIAIIVIVAIGARHSDHQTPS
jgi:hypothetical protein